MNRTLKKNILAIGTIIFWSTAFPVTRLIGGSLSAISLAFTRCVVAGIFLSIVWFSNKNRKIPAKKDIFYFIVTGATGFGIYLVVFNQGLKTITSAESSVIIAFTPVLVAILSRIIPICNLYPHQSKTGCKRLFINRYCNIQHVVFYPHACMGRSHCNTRIARGFYF